jgi:hypothetical protein
LSPITARHKRAFWFSYEGILAVTAEFAKMNYTPMKTNPLKIATSNDWKIHPLSKKRSLIPADRQFTSAESD